MITLLVIAVIVLVAIAGILYFFKPKPTPLVGGKKAPGKKLEIPQVAKDWWGKKTLEQKRWFLYVWLMIIAITVVYVVKHSFGGAYANLRFFIGGVLVLLVLHAVIWPFFAEKTSIITKAVTFAVFAFLSWSVLTPDATVRVMEIYDAKIKDINENAFKGGPPPRSADTAARYQSETEQQSSSEAISSLGLSTVAIVVPVGATIEVDRPNGHYLASVNCPKEVVMEITDVSTGQLIKQQDCAETVRNGNLPLNIKLAFFQKGDDGGPVDVLVRWKKIS